MIRNAASALLRRSTASASLSRATPVQVVPQPLQPQSTALSARGFHAAAKNTMEIEEKKAALLQDLFNEEATAAARKRNQQQLDRASLKAEKEKLKKEMEALKEARKAKAEELLAMIGRQGASGVDQETLMLAKLLQAREDIEGLELVMGGILVCLAVIGGAIGYLCFFP